MRLFDSAKAPNPRRVRWVMAEKQINDIEIVQIELFKGEHKTSDYLAKTGLPNVPALEIDENTTITESIAICRYLESIYPTPNMFGNDAKETAIIEMWMRRMEMMVSTPVMLAVRHTHPALAALEKQQPAVAESNLHNAKRSLKFLNRHLADKEFIVSDRITIADVIAFTGLDFGKMIKFALPEGLDNVARWMAAMNARAAAKAGM